MKEGKLTAGEKHTVISHWMEAVYVVMLPSAAVLRDIIRNTPVIL
jgi:hypothetical protein